MRWDAMPAHRRSIPRWLTGEEAEPTWVSIFLFALIGLSIADAIFDVVPEGVIVAAVFAALLVVVRLIRKLYPIERDTSEIVSRLQDGTTVLRFDNYDDLYEALKYRLGSAKHGLRLTHIRDDPPERFGHADFYEAVHRWPGEHPSCKVERIIALPNAEMRAWAQELREEEKRHRNFHVTVTARAAGLPVINMVIIDDLDVFVFVSRSLSSSVRQMGREFSERPPRCRLAC
jgi:hypothetical protein